MQGLGRTIHNRLNGADVGLPSLVRSSVGMAHLVAKEQTFLTDITFCHDKTSFAHRWYVNGSD